MTLYASCVLVHVHKESLGANHQMVQSGRAAAYFEREINLGMVEEV
jgi:hypothetical protein